MTPATWLYMNAGVRRCQRVQFVERALVVDLEPGGNYLPMGSFAWGTVTATLCDLVWQHRATDHESAWASLCEGGLFWRLEVSNLSLRNGKTVASNNGMV